MKKKAAIINNYKSTILTWVIFVLLVLTWGSSFILIKKGLTVFSSNEVGALRTAISSLVLLPIVFFRFSKISLKQWKLLAILGVLNGVLPPFLFAKAQTGIDSHLAGVLNSLTPLLTMIIGLIFFHLKTKWFNILGIIIGFCGTIGLLSISGGKSFEFNFSFGIYIIIATTCYAISANIIKNLLADVDAVSIAAFSFFIVGIPLIFYLLVFTDFLQQLKYDDNFFEGIIYIAILAVFGTAIALIAFNKLIKMTNVMFATSITYVIPVIALLWGIFDGESFGLINLLWISIIIIGVWLVNTGNKRMRE
jgi:drug/metabolite transporter (DMT)-like permease